MPIPFLQSVDLNKNEIKNFKISNLANEPAGLTATDVAYSWYNTTAGKFRFWDGDSTRTVLDSDATIPGAQISGNITGRSGGLTGGDQGGIVYQSATSVTAFLGLGTASQILTVDAGQTAPVWTTPSQITVGKATSIVGGVAGSLPYQTAVDATAMLPIGDANFVLKVKANGSGPEWVGQSTLSVGSAVSATNTTNIAGGAQGGIPYQTASNTTTFLGIGAQFSILQSTGTGPSWTPSIDVVVGRAVNLVLGSQGSIPYQSAASTTAMLGIGAANQVLVSSGTAPQWVNQSTISAGSATTAGSVSQALTAGSYLTSGGTYNGSAARTFAVDATPENVAGKVVARNEQGDASFRFIVGALSGNASTANFATAAGTANIATDLAGGSVGSIPYQVAANDTAFLQAPQGANASGRILTFLVDGTDFRPTWSESIAASRVSGLAASATTDTTNAANISSGVLGINRLPALAKSKIWLGDNSNRPAEYALFTLPLSIWAVPTANIDLGGFKITNSALIGAADAASTLANKGYVDSVAQGLDVKESCRVATTANIDLSNPGSITIDGVASTGFVVGTTRILVKDQTTASQNGIYIWQGSSSAMTRSTDADTWDELTGSYTFITQGTVNAYSGWTCTAVFGGTLGTTAVPWTLFSQAGTVTTNRGLAQSGSQFNFAQNSDYTAGRIPFAADATTIGFNAGLFFDSTTVRFAIGSDAPVGVIDALSANTGTTAFNNPQIRAANSGAATLNQRVDIQMRFASATSPGTGGVSLIRDAAAGAAARMVLSSVGSDGNPIVGPTVTAEGNLGLGTQTVNSLSGSLGRTLEIYGNAESASIHLTNQQTGQATTDGFVIQTETNGTKAFISQRENALLAIQTNSLTRLTIAADGSQTWRSTADLMHLTASGNLLINTNGTTALLGSEKLEVAAAASSVAGLYTFTSAASGPELTLGKSRSATIGTNNIVLDNDTIGSIVFRSADGTTYTESARISGYVNGSPAAGAVPGGLIFSTTPISSGSAVTRARIDSKGNVVISEAALTTTATDGFLYIPTCPGAPTGTPTAYAGRSAIVVDSTNSRLYFRPGDAWITSGTRKYASLLSDLTQATFTVNHGLGTSDVIVQLRKAGDPFEVVYADIKVTGANTVDVTFSSNVNGQNYRITVIG